MRSACNTRGRWYLQRKNRVTRQEKLKRAFWITWVLKEKGCKGGEIPQEKVVEKRVLGGPQKRRGRKVGKGSDFGLF